MILLAGDPKKRIAQPVIGFVSLDLGGQKTQQLVFPKRGKSRIPKAPQTRLIMLTVSGLSKSDTGVVFLLSYLLGSDFVVNPWGQADVNGPHVSDPLVER